MEVKDDGIPVAATFADTVRPEGKLFALLARGGEFRKVPLRFMSASDRAAIDAEFPLPIPPRKTTPQGTPYLDRLDAKHQRDEAAVELERLKARVAFLVPDDFIGVKTRAEKIARIWRGWSEVDILSIDRQGMNPYETREEGIQAAEVRHAPFAPTDEGGSPD